MRAALHQDVCRYKVTPDTIAVSRAFLTRPMVRFVVLLRWCQYYGKSHPLGLIARYWYKRLSIAYGLQIPHVTVIGGGLFLGHWGNIVVNKEVTIGKNCNIAQGVTLGHVSRGRKKGSPSFGDRVWIGANAVVVGKVSIGNDVLIAPLSYVNFDVPDRAVVLGNPGQIVSYNSSEGYVKHVYQN